MIFLKILINFYFCQFEDFFDYISAPSDISKRYVHNVGADSSTIHMGTIQFNSGGLYLGTLQRDKPNGIGMLKYADDG